MVRLDIYRYGFQHASLILMVVLVLLDPPLTERIRLVMRLMDELSLVAI